MTDVGDSELLASSDVISVTTGQGRPIECHYLGLVDYEATQHRMREFCASADEHTKDQIWLLEHNPVYTKGTACDLQTLLPSDIPIVQSDRGGQITYHGPGQIVMYPLLALRRHDLSVKGLVAALEQAVINLLREWQIEAARKEGAPGIYVDGEKIAALGLRIRRGWSYHGLSLNLDMDLAPFENIDPCGYAGLKTTQLKSLVPEREIMVKQVGQNLVRSFSALL